MAQDCHPDSCTADEALHSDDSDYELKYPHMTDEQPAHTTGSRRGSLFVGEHESESDSEGSSYECTSAECSDTASDLHAGEADIEEEDAEDGHDSERDNGRGSVDDIDNDMLQPLPEWHEIARSPYGTAVNQNIMPHYDKMIRAVRDFFEVDGANAATHLAFLRELGTRVSVRFGYQFNAPSGVNDDDFIVHDDESRQNGSYLHGFLLPPRAPFESLSTSMFGAYHVNQLDLTNTMTRQHLCHLQNSLHGLLEPELANKAAKYRRTVHMFIKHVFAAIDANGPHLLLKVMSLYAPDVPQNETTSSAFHAEAEKTQNNAIGSLLLAAAETARAEAHQQRNAEVDHAQFKVWAFVLCYWRVHFANLLYQEDRDTCLAFLGPRQWAALQQTESKFSRERVIKGAVFRYLQGVLSEPQQKAFKTWYYQSRYVYMAVASLGWTWTMMLPKAAWIGFRYINDKHLRLIIDFLREHLRESIDSLHGPGDLIAASIYDKCPVSPLPNLQKLEQVCDIWERFEQVGYKYVHNDILSSAAMENLGRLGRGDGQPASGDEIETT